MEGQKTFKHTRKLRNLLIAPRRQIGLIFGLPVLGLVAVIILLETIKTILSQSLVDFEADIVVHSRLYQLSLILSRVLLLTEGVLVICALMVAICGILVTHRYYGPQVTILRVLKSYVEGNYSARASLRREDELKEVMAEINSLGAALESRHPRAEKS